MIQERHRKTAGLYFFTDLAATLAAFLGAWLLRFELEVIPVTKNVPEFGPYLRLVPFVLVLWPVVFYFHGLYQSRRGRSRVDEVLTIVLAVLLATVLLSVVIAWYRPPAAPGSHEYFTYSRAFLGLFALVDLGLVATTRMVARSVLRRVRSSGPQPAAHPGRRRRPAGARDHHQDPRPPRDGFRGRRLPRRRSRQDGHR